MLATESVPLVIPSAAVLLDIHTVSSVLQRPMGAIFEMVDSGEIRWVFDVSSHEGDRCRRFWRLSVAAAASGDDQPDGTPDEIVGIICRRLPQHVGVSALASFLAVGSRHVYRLVDGGTLPAVKGRAPQAVERGQVDAWLQSRVIA